MARDFDARIFVAGHRGMVGSAIVALLESAHADAWDENRYSLVRSDYFQLAHPDSPCIGPNTRQWNQRPHSG